MLECSRNVIMECISILYSKGKFREETLSMHRLDRQQGVPPPLLLLLSRVLALEMSRRPRLLQFSSLR